MTESRTSPPRPYNLDCNHVVWYRRAHAPQPGESVFCVKCNHEVRVIDHDTTRGTYYPDAEWMCYKVTQNVCRGLCYRDGTGCGYEKTGPFNRLQNQMERHNRLGCDSTDLLDIQTVMLPPNSPPPF